jgi:hypothetical protein
MRTAIMLQVFPEDGAPKVLPQHALELPRGRLMFGEFEIDFTPDQVLGAMATLLEWWGEGMNLPGDKVFPSQACVLAFANEHLNYGHRSLDREFHAQ